jgi:riboflavin synthase
MFTGIVQGFCPVMEAESKANMRRIRIDMSGLADGLQIGASVAVNGTCLTVTDIRDDTIAFDVIQETLDNTSLGSLTKGSRVNVERSLQFGDEVGGHILSGHISARISVCGVEVQENARVVGFSVPADLMKYIHHKGFVALDGASLTIANVDAQACEFTVALIPETIARTTLGSVVLGDWVNLEVDKQTQAVVDTVERLVNSPEWRGRLAAD